MRSILITDCLQKDFVEPVGRFDGLQSALHIGHDESLRLLGASPAEGPVARMMVWAHAQSDTALKVIHIRDWHDSADPEQRGHLEQFGDHCLKNSVGSDFVFSTDNLSPEKQLEIVDATTLSNFVGARMADVLEPYRDKTMRIGLMGVWTEAKITFLAYDLRTRYPHFQLAVCSALTASSSRENHFLALDQLERILGVKIIPSVGEFIEYLGGRAEDAPLIGFSQKHPEVRMLDETKLKDTDLLLLRYLFRGCRQVEARTLDGGFSGNVVLKTQSTDLHGHEQVPHVVKIGPKAPIGKERTSFERIEAVLGNSAPRIADFADLQDRGAIKYRYATMGRGKSRSFQKLYESGVADSELKQVFDSVFLDQLGRFYRAADLEKSDLLQYYEFKPELATLVENLVAEVLGVQGNSDLIEFPNGQRLPSIVAFYEKTLKTLPRFQRSTYFSYIHGDLNGANIIIDGQENVWLIDFSHTHRGHVLKDLIKLENDLLYIFTKINGEEELLQAMHLSDLMVEVADLARPLSGLNESVVTNTNLRRVYRHVQMLREYYPDLIKADREPAQWLVGHIRYAVHTLSFAESNIWQKRWALYTACLAAQTLTRRLSLTGPLRIDWFPSSVTAPGRLGVTIVPGRRDFNRSLGEDMKAIKKEGVSAVVCLLSRDEFQRYGVEDLLHRYKESDIEVHHLPVVDGRAPNNDELSDVLEWLTQRLETGKNVLVHCVGGLGRAGTVAACFLKSKGLDTDAAIGLVRQVRSSRAIETEIQERFISNFRPSSRVVAQGEQNFPAIFRTTPPGDG